MTLETWLENAVRDAHGRGLDDLRALLEALARSTSELRAADWNVDLLPPTDDSQGARGD